MMKQGHWQNPDRTLTIPTVCALLKSEKLHATSRIWLREVEDEASCITGSMAGGQLEPCYRAGRWELALDSLIQ